MNSLEKEVLKLVGEDTANPDVFTNDNTGMAQIRDSLNHAIQQICMATGSYVKRYFLPLRADAQIYRMKWMKDHFGYVLNAFDRSRHWRLDQTDVMKLTNEDPDWISQTGFPEKYFHIGYQFIGIYRVPSASDTVIEMDCMVIPQMYTEDTDPVKLRETFERGAIQLAVSEYHASRGDAKRGEEWLNKCLETIGLKRLNPMMGERRWQWRPSQTV